MTMKANMTISAVADKTGLTTHTIRAWERRYKVLQPNRTDTNRRLYSNEDVDKLLLLKAGVDRGHLISQLTLLSEKYLKKLAGPMAQERSYYAPNSPLVSKCIEAIELMDARSLEEIMIRSAATLGLHSFIFDLVVPVIRVIDEGWSKGSIRIRQEHLASATLRAVLDSYRSTLSAQPNAPKLIVSTPQGQLHELGALMAAILASGAGWSTHYLGPNLPAEEIAQAAKETNAQAIALSIVYPFDDATTSHELCEIRDILPSIPILVGGRASANYAAVLRRIKATRFNDLREFPSALQKVRV